MGGSGCLVVVAVVVIVVIVVVVGFEFWVISGDDDDCFSFYFGILEGFRQFCEASSVYSFEAFGQFDADCSLAVSEYGERFCEELTDSEGRFVDDEGMGQVAFHFEEGAAAPWFSWWEALEGIAGSRQPGAEQGDGDGAGARDDFDVVAGRDGCDNGRVAGVADARVAGVAAKADFFAGVKQFDDFFGHASFVVFMVGDDDGRLGDVQQFEEVTSVPGVFAGKGVEAAEGFAGARGYVLQIADWGCNQSECSHERCLLERMGEREV